MLRELAIKNFAIIEDVKVSFSDGLTVLSGETGAGKSILVQAVNILLGSRADSGQIRSGADSAELEALFEIDPDGVIGKKLEDAGYADGNELLIRRVISSRSNHRIYINGRMATLSTLSAITGGMASISGQHEHQRLLRDSEHQTLIDRFAGLSPLVKQVKETHDALIFHIHRVREIENMQRKAAERLEQIIFEEKEIEDADISITEEAELEQERTRLKNAAMLYEKTWDSIHTLYDDEGSVTERLAYAKQNLAAAAGTDPSLAEHTDALSDALYRIEDIVSSLRSYAEAIEFNDRRLEQIEERISTIKRLKRKYGGSVESMHAHLEKIKAEKAEMEDSEILLSEENKEIDALGARLSGLVKKLSERRKKSSTVLCRHIERELTSLNMPDARFSVSFQYTPAGEGDHPALVLDGKRIMPFGLERQVFMMSPNAGENLRPLAKIASGGELSRVILAIKAILSDTGPVETIIFDEVDAGIGGKTGETVGEKLAALAERNQVICITHLAQIGKFADHHYRITKQVENGRTKTTITPLDLKGRILEMARMIGGSSITEKTLAHAEEMLCEKHKNDPDVNTVHK